MQHCWHQLALLDIMGTKVKRAATNGNRMCMFPHCISFLIPRTPSSNNIPFTWNVFLVSAKSSMNTGTVYVYRICTNIPLKWLRSILRTVDTSNYVVKCSPHNSGTVSNETKWFNHCFITFDIPICQFRSGSNVNIEMGSVRKNTDPVWYPRAIKATSQESCNPATVSHALHSRPNVPSQPFWNSVLPLPMPSLSLVAQSCSGTCPYISRYHIWNVVPSQDTPYSRSPREVPMTSRWYSVRLRDVAAIRNQFPYLFERRTVIWQHKKAVLTV